MLARFFNKASIKQLVLSNIVSIIFIALSLIGMMLSELNSVYIFNELINRISRNSFLVLSLLIPILAGLGLNFGLVIGAMAGQLSIIAVTYWQVDGILGFLLCIVLALPISILFGYLTGRLFNATKGQEMIAGLIVSFFANGLYQFLLLVMVGTAIPMKNSVMIKPDGIGLRNTIALNGVNGDGGIKYALDGIFRLNLFYFIIILAVLLIIYSLYNLKRIKKDRIVKKSKETYIVYVVSSIVLIVISILILLGDNMYKNLKIPLITWIVISVLCLFNKLIMRTKIGQNFRTVGHSQHIAKVAGINVNRTRIQAVIISTVLASWGQIIFLQNIGTMNTYGSHMQVAMFSIAAILIGGASVTNAKISHAITGVVLFHMIFIVSPTAGKALFGDAQIGEFFRAFVVYGVIGVSLGLHAWKKYKLGKM
ncbi:ABC transporter permease subunit [Vallitalea maricola]|uniref:ABC transporter permease n=1 Tax=Vallitalea maricola TaxID=3074433 RepID=A0ACB5UEH8_9FIRM|nr:ABC transporter permease [Vallitalea sp. AN17-2]